MHVFYLVELLLAMLGSLAAMLEIIIIGILIKLCDDYLFNLNLQAVSSTEFKKIISFY